MATVWVRIKSEGGPRWDASTGRWQQAGEELCVDEDQLRLFLNHAEIIPNPSHPSEPSATPSATEAVQEIQDEPSPEIEAAPAQDKPSPRRFSNRMRTK